MLGLSVDAVLLCAGIGSRFGGLTANRPKCLLTVIDKSILEMQLDALFSSNRINRVFVVVGYMSKVIEATLQNHPFRHQIVFVYNYEFQKTNNMFSLSLVEDFFKGEEFILCNGDVAFEAKSICRFSNEDKSELLFDSSRFTQDGMKVQLNSCGALLNLGKEITRESSRGISADIFKFSSDDSLQLFRTVREIIESGALNNWTEFAIEKLCKSGDSEIVGVDIRDDKWFEIDNVEDLKSARSIFSKNIPLDTFQHFIFDLDGTLILGGEAIPGSITLLKNLRQLGKSIYYVTNNSSLSDEDHIERLKRLDFPVSDGCLISSTRHTLNYLTNSSHIEIFLLGTQSVARDFVKAGISIGSQNPELVVVANDTEVTYEKLSQALSFIHNGVPYVLTHADISCPTDRGLMPDAGTWGSMIARLTGKGPIVVFGKPSVGMIEMVPEFAQDSEKGDSELSSRYLIFGDRLEFDVALGLESRITTVLTLSGSTNEEEFQNSKSKPNFVIDSIANLL